ncbi:MAG: helix-turn-helix transcriptional regulator [Streptosporangiales bacterium]|nr:helix-turn-helix transcriptional regulator [Streptosporangiales bacterium]
MSNRFELTDETPVYVISVAAQLAGMHPQTLRQYDRLGLVSPDRAAGRGRRYSLRDVELLREVQRLSQEGVNLAGIKRLLALQQQVSRLATRVVELEHELAAAHQALKRHGGTTRGAPGRPQAPAREAALDATAVTLWRSRDI